MANPGLKEKHRPYKAAVLTVSDSCAAGLRQDLSGPQCRQWLESQGFTCKVVQVVPDGIEPVVAALQRICDGGDVQLVITSGGTGLSPRDWTPEATRQVVTREVPGLGELLRFEGSRQNPRAYLSRGTAGIRNGVLIINLPGSVRGVTESLAALSPVLTHALETAAGDASRCGG